MARPKKKRNKHYQGRDARIAQPQVIRVEAANRNRVSQWWFDRKQFLKPILIAIGVVLLVVWLIFELIRVIF